MLFGGSRRDFYPLCHRVERVTERVCPIFALNHRVHSAAQTFSDPPISLLKMLTHIPCSSILRGYKLRVEGEGELSLFNNEFALFCIDNQAQLSVHISNHCFKRVLEFFDAVQGFYINSAPGSNCLFVFILLTRSNTNY